MVTVNWIINAHKILVTPIVLAMMWYFQNWSAAAFLYLGLHGTYTLLWLIKQSVFADKRFAQPIPLWIGVLTPFLPLMAYVIGPYLLISEHTYRRTRSSLWRHFFAFLVCSFTTSAMHRNSLSCSCAKGLIQKGLFAVTRNPNYLGEVLTYGGFALRLTALAALRGVCWLVRACLRPQHAPERRVDVSPS